MPAQFERFPWRSHRTLAEVAETEQLLTSREERTWPKAGVKARRLDLLLGKRDQNNPAPGLAPETA